VESCLSTLHQEYSSLHLFLVDTWQYQRQLPALKHLANLLVVKTILQTMNEQRQGSRYQQIMNLLETVECKILNIQNNLEAVNHKVWRAKQLLEELVVDKADDIGEVQVTTTKEERTPEAKQPPMAEHKAAKDRVHEWTRSLT
jgi:NAD+--asparagine ADP-ribosyltransferase